MTLRALAEFATNASPPSDARHRAGAAILDTIGVALAGASEPASRAVQLVLFGPDISLEPGVPSTERTACTVLGSRRRATAPGAALANGTSAHALDYDDMCFVSLAHPSAPLVPALLAAGEITGASGAALVDAYVAGFEIEARLGRVMNPRHYQRGWHCTSTLGAIGAAVAASRVLGLDSSTACHAIAIAASEASGLKENFGTMVKPLHAGLAARDGVLAALLARSGLTGSPHAIDGPQGFLRAMDSARADLAGEISDLGTRWELLDTGITVKLYPSCAATHPTLDAILALREREGLTADDVARIEVDVDAITPTVLIYERPSTGLEGKFSMPFCAAAAVVDGRVGIDTFDPDRLADPRVTRLIPCVTMRVDSTLGVERPPLTQARVHVHLRSGRTVSEAAEGARGYPARPASRSELEAKFLSCATRALPESKARRVLELLEDIHSLDDVRTLTAACRPDR